MDSAHSGGWERTFRRFGIEETMALLAIIGYTGMMRRTNSLEKTLTLRKIEGRRRWLDGNHRLHGHEFEEAVGVGDGQGSLACCSSWDCKESDTTE